MWLALAASLAATAGTVPVSLPPGVDVAAWTEPFAAAGLELGPSADSVPRATIVGVGMRWRLTVVDRAGVGHQVIVSPPTTPAERSDLAWLVASLVRPTVALGALPPLPARPASPPPLRPPTTPIDVPAGSAKSAPTPVPPTPAEPEAPEVVSTTPESPLLEPPSPPTAYVEFPPDSLGLLPPHLPADARRVTTTGVWGRAGGGVGLRDGGAFAPGLEIGIGPAIGVTRLGVSVAWTAPAPIAAAGPRRRVASVDTLLGGWWTPQTGALLGIAVAWSERTWSDEGAAIARDGLPLLALEAGGAIPLRPGWRLLPTLRLQQDLAPTQLVVDGAPIGRLPPTTVTVRIGIDATTTDPFAPVGTLDGR
ncbi:MAG: hypothetical protein ACI9K2_003861 [Myxococcota bacterium]|jgi:hypothetical protein